MFFFHFKSRISDNTNINIPFNFIFVFPNIICILTGGDSEFLAKRLKNSIFTHQNLVLKGLNDILNYNLEKK